MKWFAVLALMLFAVTGFCAQQLADFDDTRVPASYTYEGKVLMDAAEYSEFKYVVARDEVFICKMSVYSSEDPLVIFEVRVPADMEFQWGEASVWEWDYPVPTARIVATVFGAVIAGMIGLVFAFAAVAVRVVQE